MKKRIIISSLFFLIISSFISNLHSAGAIFEYNNRKWELFDQEAQYCVINYHNDEQKMILIVSTAERFQGQRAVWIFPVPAEPEEIKIFPPVRYPRPDGVSIDYDFRGQAEN